MRARRGGGVGGGVGVDRGEGEWEEDGGGEVWEEENWASVVDNGADERLLMREDDDLGEKNKGKREKRKGYFSDESDEEE
ncbi:unnamed protein product [Ilex paraguariensis]|uniref:Uncharacterized protein n=1 Tax=Ilex paraguariensis TaxID=185542 RepID=A0ABC8SR41_9AQUA